MKWRVVPFGGVFMVLFVEQVGCGVKLLQSVAGASLVAGLFALTFDAYMRICNYVCCALKNALAKTFEKVSAWRSRHRRRVRVPPFLACGL